MRKLKEHMTQDELKKMRRASYIKMVAMFGFVVAVMVFSSIAWFTMNREVEGSGAQMTSTDLPFDLKTVSNVPPNSAVPNADLLNSKYADGETVTKKIENIDTAVGNITSNTDGSIKWLLNSEDDFYKGIQPGSHGMLQFYIVPKDPTQNLTVTCHLNLTPYKMIEVEADDGNGGTVKVNQLALLNPNSQKGSEKKAIELLKGHILFFRERNTVNDNLVYSDRLRLEANDYLNVTVTPADLALDTSTDSQKGKLVTIYWVWPITMGKVLGYNDNVSICKTAADQTELDGTLCAHPEMFLDISSDSALNTVLTTTDGVKTLNASALARTGADGLEKYFGYMSIGYNNADQDIGINVNYILVELSAESN